MQMYLCERPDRMAEQRETVRILVELAKGWERMADNQSYGDELREDALTAAMDYITAATVLANS